MDVAILLHRQIFINKDGSEGILYLISNSVKLDKQSIETIYQKRWRVEVFHKNIKLSTAPSNTKNTEQSYFSVIAGNCEVGVPES